MKPNLKSQSRNKAGKNLIEEIKLQKNVIIL